MAPRTLFDKIWDQHRVRELADGVALLAIDRVFLHERTGSVALKGLAAAAARPLSATDPVRSCRNTRSMASSATPSASSRTLCWSQILSNSVRGAIRMLRTPFYPPFSPAGSGRS